MVSILSFDPSTTSTGWASMSDDGKVIQKHGQLRPKGATKDRILAMGHDAYKLAVSHRPSCILIEEPDDQGIVGRTTGTQALLAAVSYYIAGRVDDYTGRVTLIPVQMWKKSVPKEVVYRRLLSIYGPTLPKGTEANPWNNDAVDAVGIAYWWTHIRK